MPAPTLNVELDLVGTGWTSITSDVREISIDHGAGPSADPRILTYDAAEMKLRVRSRSAKYQPFNTASSLYGKLRHGQKVRVRATGVGSIPGGDYLFSGRVERFEDVEAPGGRELEAVLTCYDPLADLAGIDLAIQAPTFAGDEVSARLARILTSSGWSGLGWTSSLAAGSTTLAATSYARKALAEARLAVEADGGHLWCDPDGTIVYEPRDLIATSSRSRTPQSTFGTGVGEIPFRSGWPSSDRKTVVSQVSLTRAGGVPQVVSGPTTYGPQVFKRTDLQTADDVQVRALAKSIYERWSLPRMELPEIDVVGTDDSYPAILRRRIRDLVRVRYAYPFAVDVDAWVTGRRLSIVDKQPWVCTFRLSAAGPWAAQSYFVVGTSVVGGSDFVLW